MGINLKWYAIDLDKNVNIPNTLIYHLLTIHKAVFYRLSASATGIHIIYKNDDRCKICDSFSDPNFVAIQEQGKPLILWTTKTYRQLVPGIAVKKQAGPWLKLKW